MNTQDVDWGRIASRVFQLSHAELVRAGEAAAKEVILVGGDRLDTSTLIAALEARRATRHD